MKDFEQIISGVINFDLVDEKRHLEANLFSSKQKLAIIKAVAYVLSSDSIITAEEKKFFIQLLSVMKVNEDMVKESLEHLNDNDMLSLLDNLTEEQETFILNCLAAAAMSDENLAEEEKAFLDSFSKKDLSNNNIEICKQLLTI